MLGGVKDDTSQFTGADKPGAQPAGAPPYSAFRFNADRAGAGGYNMGFRSYDPGLNQFLTRDMYAGALGRYEPGHRSVHRLPV